jgi:hypothetical protein
MDFGNLIPEVPEPPTATTPAESRHENLVISDGLPRPSLDEKPKNEPAK